MAVKEQIEALRKELHQHNYNYYVLNAPVISDKEFDDKMRLLQDLEASHPEFYDASSPTMRVGSDLSKDFKQVAHNIHIKHCIKYAIHINNILAIGVKPKSNAKIRPISAIIGNNIWSLRPNSFVYQIVVIAVGFSF